MHISDDYTVVIHGVVSLSLQKQHSHANKSVMSGHISFLSAEQWQQVETASM